MADGRFVLPPKPRVQELKAETSKSISSHVANTSTLQATKDADDAVSIRGTESEHGSLASLYSGSDPNNRPQHRPYCRSGYTSTGAARIHLASTATESTGFYTARSHVSSQAPFRHGTPPPEPDRPAMVLPHNPWYLAGIGRSCRVPKHLKLPTTRLGEPSPTERVQRSLEDISAEIESFIDFFTSSKIDISAFESEAKETESSGRESPQTPSETMIG